MIHRLLLILTAVVCTTTTASACITLDKPLDNVVLLIPDGRVKLTGIALGIDEVKLTIFESGKPPSEIIKIRVDHDKRFAHEVTLPVNVATHLFLEQRGCREVLDLLVTPINSSAVARRTPSVYQLDWFPSGEEKIADIGQLTLSPFTDAPGFVNEVKAETLRVTQEFLAEFAIRVGTSEASNKVRFTGTAEADLFGATLPRGDGSTDCGDVAQDDLINIYVGSLHTDIVTRRTIWQLLDTGDPRSMRITDLAHILGTLAAHEILHASGLVRCEWMQGDPRGHNNARFEIGRPKRYGAGSHLMDTFAAVDPATMIGRTDRTTAPRQKLVHDDFSASYLQLIHPRN